jgi:hypothetical protein
VPLIVADVELCEGGGFGCLLIRRGLELSDYHDLLVFDYILNILFDYDKHPCCNIRILAL